MYRRPALTASDLGIAAPANRSNGPLSQFPAGRLPLCRGCRQQLGKLIVSDFGLGDQDTAAEMIGQIAADRPEPPSRQRPGGAMTYHDEIRTDLFSDRGDLLRGGSHAQPRRR